MARVGRHIGFSRAGLGVSYVAPARELLACGTFTVGGYPELVRTPGYPLMLVPALWLGHLGVVTVTLQILLSALTVWGVYLLAPRRAGDSRVAVAAAVLYAVQPLSIVYVAELRPETLFAAMVVWAAVLQRGWAAEVMPRAEPTGRLSRSCPMGARADLRAFGEEVSPALRRPLRGRR